MNALFSWTSLAVATTVLVLILVAFRVFGRIKVTARTRGADTASPWTQKPCPHLGLLDEPFIHRDDPDEDHRCFLWMQRDRIDLTHQAGFCLNSAHVNCPWLGITPPVAQAPFPQRLGTGMVTALEHGLNNSFYVVTYAFVWLVLQGRKLIQRTRRRADVAVPAAASIALEAAQFATPRVAKASRVVANAVRAAGISLWAWLAPVAVQAAGRIGAAGRGALQRRSKPEVAVTPIVESAADSAPEPTPGEATVQRPRPIPSLQPLPSQVAVSRIDNLMEQGKVAGMCGNRALACSLFSMVIDLDARNDEAWLWKGAMADNAQEKLACLQWALAINPDNERAQQAIRQMANSPWAIEAALGVSLPNVTTATASAPVAPAAPSEQPRASAPASIVVPQVVSEASPAVAAAFRTPTARQKVYRAPALDSLTNEEALVTAALECLEHGDEDSAHDMFVKATVLSPRSEKAWFWRAKTSETLDETINSLQQAIAINPGNEKVRANLAWAIQRQQMEEEAKEAERKAAAVEQAKAKVQARPRRSVAAMCLRWLSAVICLALAVYWVSVALMPLVDNPLLREASESLTATTEIDLAPVYALYQANTRWLADLTWASVPWHEKLEIASGYSLLAAIPYTIGFLYFFVAIGVFRRQTWSRWWGLAVTVLSLGLGIFFSANPQAVLLLSTLGLATLVMLLASHSEFRRDLGEDAAWQRAETRPRN